MKERPILFSGPMVQAILEGRKTQTRRVVKSPDPCCFDPRPIRKDYEVGMRLWVRESFNWSSAEDLLAIENSKLCPERKAYSSPYCVYRADGEREHPKHGKALWRPSIHMPRLASRITLEITKVKVDRLKDISIEDIRAEGAMHALGNDDFAAQQAHKRSEQIGRQFEFGVWAERWDAINGMRGFGWGKNPWVWVIEFKRVAQSEAAA